MKVTSKTGLIASPRKRVIRFIRTPELPCALTKQAEFSLGPFGGLYNPYSYGCSILCNHPAALEMKNVVKQAKEAWIIEGKAFTMRDDLTPKRENSDLNSNKQGMDLPEHVPEEFFRRYTGVSDSRPLTPTPTVASGRTRESRTGSLLNTRRCVTPEPTGSHTKERKQLILDLRRSHSQETLYWNASSELSPAPQEQWTQPPPDTPKKQSTEKIQSPPIIKPEIEPIQKEDSLICINARDDDDDDDDEPRRRGKKRKKPKAGVTASFSASQDPETQVAIGFDSPNQSARPSIPNELIFINSVQSSSQLNFDDKLKRSSCFLDDDSLKILRRGLNLDIVENQFERYMNRALKEAYRTIPHEKLNVESDVIKELKEHLNLPELDHEKWINLPRKYSRISARFELPLDSGELHMMTPLEYLSKYVTVSNAQKQIYRRIFLRNLPEEPPEEENLQEEDDDDDDVQKCEIQKKHVIREVKERLLPFCVVELAMKQTLGFHGTTERINEIKEILELEEDLSGFSFRTWCGIIAFSERFLITVDREIDPCNEIETADFESLERRIMSVVITKNLSTVLLVIKNN